jgi:hypothetical protein
MADLKSLSDEQLLELIEKSRRVAPEVGLGENLGDFARGAYTGGVEGGAAIVGLPGDIESLARWGATKLAGGDSRLIQQTSAPTSEQARQWYETNIGQLPEPKGAWGKAGRTFGQMMPAAAGPVGPARGAAGLVQRGINVVAPTVGAELGERVGGEYGKVAGALAGGVLGMRSITPVPAAPAHLQQARALEREGVRLSAGQRTGSKRLRWAEEAAADQAFAGGAVTRLNNEQKEQFTRAVLRRIGEDAPRATPEVIDRFLTRVGRVFDRQAAYHGVPLDSPLLTEVQQIWRRYMDEVAEPFRAPIVERIAGEIWDMAQNQRALGGEWYANTRTRLEQISRNTRNPELQEAVNELRHALDDALERGAQITGRTADMDVLREARRQYRNYIPIERAITGSGAEVAEGVISPSQLRNAVVQAHGRRNYARGRGDFEELVRAGEAVMKPLPQSGTAPRQQYQGVLGMLGGFGGGVEGAVSGIATGTVLPGMVGRAVTNPWIQQYLGNQVLPTGQNLRRQLMIDFLLARSPEGTTAAR